MEIIHQRPANGELVKGLDAAVLRDALALFDQRPSYPRGSTLFGVCAPNNV
jgi:hypothetical protein